MCTTRICQNGSKYYAHNSRSEVGNLRMREIMTANGRMNYTVYSIDAVYLWWSQNGTASVLNSAPRRATFLTLNEMLL